MTDKTHNPDNADRTNALKDRFCALEHRIAQACRAAGRRREEVQLLAVSKTRTASEIRNLHDLGAHCFGENYLNEAVDKQAQLQDLKLNWHFIGPIQSNKTAAIAEHFDWVQSVDREKIIRRLASQRRVELKPLNVLIQVNIDEEPQKSGCSPQDIFRLADLIAAHPQLKLRGLMAIPSADLQQIPYAFKRMRAAFDELAQHQRGIDTLSIGMSGDLEMAIAAGSSMIRIGTALFGPRPAANTKPI